MIDSVILIDGPEWKQLNPLTLTRSTASIRMGILTFKERWTQILKREVQVYTQAYIQAIYGKPILQDTNIFINPLFFPNQALIDSLHNLQQGEALVSNEGEAIAAFCSLEQWQDKAFTNKKKASPSFKVNRCWDIFTYNHLALEYDYQLVTKGRESQPISESNGCIGDHIFLEPGAKVEFCTLNSNSGPIYIGKDCEVMEGSNIRGGLALCNNAKINLGSKIYGATTIGPYCKVGGEINNSILTGYSNKGHEGFLGNSVLGEWCNLGADTNNSNLKNNYSTVRMWDYVTKKEIETKLQFCGLIMGDHAKSAINSQFNTGTSVGVGANIFCSEFPPKRIESFSWGGKKDAPKFDFKRFCEAADKAKSRRNKTLTEEEVTMHAYIFKKFT